MSDNAVTLSPNLPRKSDRRSDGPQALDRAARRRRLMQQEMVEETHVAQRRRGKVVCCSSCRPGYTSPTFLPRKSAATSARRALLDFGRLLQRRPRRMHLRRVPLPRPLHGGCGRHGSEDVQKRCLIDAILTVTAASDIFA